MRSYRKLRDRYCAGTLREKCKRKRYRFRIVVKAMSEDTCATRSSYVRQSRLSYGEDRRREFKGHRNLSAEEIPLRLKHSRRAVSRYILPLLSHNMQAPRGPAEVML